MPRITISYRRGDSLDITGRIFDRLSAHFGRDAVFRDIDNIPVGVDFRRHLETVLDASDVVLAIVGPRWVGPRPNQSRLANAADPVRVEIEIVLSKDKPLIPVLVSRAVMPSPEELPESIQDFVYRHALQVDSGQDFDVHLGRLIRAIERLAEVDEAQATNKVVQRAITAVGVAPQIHIARDCETIPEQDMACAAPEDTPPTESVVEQTAAVPLPESPVITAASADQRAPALRRGGSRLITSAILVMLAVFGASGWWLFVGRPAEIAQHEAAAAARALAEEQTRQAAVDKARQDEAARQAAAAAAKTQQDEQDRQAAAEKAQPGEAAPQATTPVPAPALPTEITAFDATEKANSALDRKDYAEAMRWYRLAADRGSAFAQNQIGGFYQNGWGVALNYAEAMRWYRKAADQGNDTAQANIGFLYERGGGVAQDYAEAMRWLRKGADQGNASAEGEIGMMYLKGWGVTRDYAEAMRWSRKAADKGLAAAQTNVGAFYLNGWGVPQSFEQARQWIQKGAAGGDENAKRWLAEHPG